MKFSSCWKLFGTMKMKLGKRPFQPKICTATEWKSIHFCVFFFSKTNLANICLHVENVKMPMKHLTVFPEYNCLILSPANLWQQNTQNFKKDTNLLSTIFHQHVSSTNFPIVFFSLHFVVYLPHYFCNFYSNCLIIFSAFHRAYKNRRYQ